MQGLQELWDLPREGYSWAAAGYMGAIGSGQTTCGLLIGPSLAIGLRCGQGRNGPPDENEDERNKAIRGAGRLYRAFIKEFGGTDCKLLSGCDFSNPDDVKRYAQDKVWKSRCDVFLKFVMTKCVEMAEEGKI